MFRSNQALLCHFQAKMMHFPTWVDLKGQDAVPETVHHVICYVDPTTDTSWKTAKGITVSGVM